MRIFIAAFGLIAACQPTNYEQSAVSKETRYSSMSCAQLISARTALEREATFFPSRANNEIVSQGVVMADPAGAMIRGYNASVWGAANAAQARRLSHAATLRAQYRDVNAEITSRGC